jgi:hypothetical protein
MANRSRSVPPEALSSRGGVPRLTGRQHALLGKPVGDCRLFSVSARFRNFGRDKERPVAQLPSRPFGREEMRKSGDEKLE